MFYLVKVSALSIPKAQVINVCAEDTGWSPYSIIVEDASNDHIDISGFNRDLLEEIFKKSKVKLNFVIKPWQRCLKEAVDGDVHIVLDAASNEQRMKDYLLTNSIYRMTPAYIFHKSLNLKNLTSHELLKNTPICGQSGYTYTNFGIPNDIVKKLSKSLVRIIDLINVKRCSVGLTRMENLKQELSSFKDYENIAYSKILDAKKEDFFWLINKNFPFSTDLKEHIDREISLLKKSGFMSKLYLKYKL